MYVVSSEYEAQSADLEKELQDALTSRKELESTNEGKRSLSNVCSTLQPASCQLTKIQYCGLNKDDVQFPMVNFVVVVLEMSSKMRSIDRELRGLRMEKEDIERVSPVIDGVG